MAQFIRAYPIVCCRCRAGAWRGPYEEGTLFFYLDEHAKDQAKDLLSVLAATGDWLAQALKKQSTLVEKNIDALANLLQLNQAERALLLYGTLARYQRDLRSMLVEFKVNNAPEADAAIADVAGVKANEVAEALRAGSRLERIGMVENLISEHNITDLADLMKVSEKLPPVLMREYRDQNELMAVFTRPVDRSRLALTDFSFAREESSCWCPCCSMRVLKKGPGLNTCKPLNLNLAAQFHDSVIRQIQKIRRTTGVVVHLRKQLFPPRRHAAAY